MAMGCVVGALRGGFSILMFYRLSVCQQVILPFVRKI
jgi:hypothetical protein